MQGEYELRRQRLIQRRIKEARFPVIKTLEQFRWDWPKKINRLAVQNLFRLNFVRDKANVILLGTVGLGKSHLASALGYAACQAGLAVRFANAINVINELSAPQKEGRLKRQLHQYLRPELLILDEVGYENRSTIMTSNRPLEEWSKLLGDVPTAGAILDRFLHHAQTIAITGRSYRLKDVATVAGKEDKNRKSKSQSDEPSTAGAAS